MSSPVKCRLLLILLFLLLVACRSIYPEAPKAPTTIITLTPSPILVITQQDEPALTETSAQLVSLHIFTHSSGSGAGTIGKTMEVVLEAVPIIRTITFRDDGSQASVSEMPWSAHPVAEMQVCFGLDSLCQLGNQWLPFVMTEESMFMGGSAKQKYDLQVDWIGPRTLWIVARFRDKEGKSIFSYESPSGEGQIISQIPVDINGTWDEAIPVTAQPPVVQTAIAATQITYPVIGSVLIEGGASARGGIAGDTISLRVDLTASSPFGAVTDMRITPTNTCSLDWVDLSGVSWEPFMSSKTYTMTLPINWVGFYIGAQFRDEQGNLSPVYCDDISVEGMPPTPVP